MVRCLRGRLVLLFLIALIGCLETDPTEKGVLFVDEDEENESSYTPPTPIFRDVRITASASHLTAGLAQGSEIDQFTVVLSDLSLSSATTGEDSPSLTDQNLLLDLTDGEPVEIGSVRLPEDSPYDEVRLIFSEITIEGLFESDTRAYTFEYSSSEPTESSAAIPTDLFALDETSSDMQALAVPEASQFLEITLPTLETYEEIISVLQEFVVAEELPPEVPIIITADSTDPIARSIREKIHRRFGIKREARTVKTRKGNTGNQGESMKPREEKAGRSDPENDSRSQASSREGVDNKPAAPASSGNVQGNDDQQGKKGDIGQEIGNSPANNNQQAGNLQGNNDQQVGNKTEQRNETQVNSGGSQETGNSGGNDTPQNTNGNRQNNDSQETNTGSQGKKKK